MPHASGPPRGARPADDRGSLMETMTALVVMSLAAVMVLTFNLSALRVHRQAQLHATIAALLDSHGAPARRIDCVRNAGLIEACGPEPAVGSHKISKPAGEDKSAGESGHLLIDLEWVDYYRPDDTTGCTSDGVAPSAVREITASWRSGGADRSEMRLVLGPRMPLTRAWTAEVDSGPGRAKFEYEPTGEALPVPSYGRGTDTSGNVVHCKVLVAPPGKTLGVVVLGVARLECKLAEGWNQPNTGDCLG